MIYALRAALLAMWLLWPILGHAAVAFDTFNVGATGTGNLTWSHTADAAAKGVLVMCGYTASSTDEISTVTYDGISMTEVTGSPVLKSTGTAAAVHGFFLGSGVTTGARTIVVTVTGATGKRCSSWTVTAADDTQVDATDTLMSDGLDDPSDSVMTTTSTFIAATMVNGEDAIANVNSGTGYTTDLESDLTGDGGIYMMHRTAIASAGSVTYSWTTAVADDVTALAVAIREGVTVAAGTPGILGGGIGAFIQ